MKAALLWYITLSLLLCPTQAQETYPYLVLKRLYEFSYLDSLPCVSIRTMQWDSQLGFSELTEAPHYLYTIVDFAKQRHGYVLQDVTSGKPFVLWMRYDLGSDKMPHVSEASWLSCEEVS